MRKPNVSREARPPLRLFVNPMAVWTDLMLKGGGMVLASMEAAAARANSGRVGVIPTADAPGRAARATPKAASKGKSSAKAKRKAKRKAKAKRR